MFKNPTRRLIIIGAGVIVLLAAAAVVIFYFGADYLYRRIVPLPPYEVPAGEFNDIIFLHHSCGHNLIEEGGVREAFSEAGYYFFDHGYNGDGLRYPDGEYAGRSYRIPDDNTDPDGLAALFAQPLHDPPDNALSFLFQHDVIIVKSCFPNSNIESEAELAEIKGYYLSMRAVMRQHPEKVFIIVTQPPLVPDHTTPENATRARALTDWLVSAEFQGEAPNLFVFDFFDLLADENNVLRAEYRWSDDDSHPNDVANQTIGPVFVDFVIESIESYKAAN